MSERAKIVGVVIMRDANAPLEIVEIPVLKEDSGFTGLFWHESSIDKLLVDYYSKKQVPLTPALEEELSALGRDISISQYIRPEDIQLLWREEYQGKLPFMMAKDLHSPVKAFR